MKRKERKGPKEKWYGTKDFPDQGVDSACTVLLFPFPFPFPLPVFEVRHVFQDSRGPIRRENQKKCGYNGYDERD